jgi:hypothetical protein
VTETTPDRSACPAWCEQDHSRDHAPDLLPAQHLGGAVPAVYLAGGPLSDSVFVFAHRVGDGEPDVIVRGRVHGGDPAADPGATLTGNQAAAVAGLVEMLAGVSPERHREVAAAIRQTIAVTGEEADR